MTDDRFERELRGFLVARAPAGASPRLRSQVASVTADIPIAAPRWRMRTIGPWRGAVGLAATAVAAVLLIALISQWGRATIREDDTVGAPSIAPVPSRPPFIEAPASFFTPAALEAAEGRLRRVFEATRVEGTLIVRTMPDADTLIPPDGWQERYDRDGDDRRDVVAVAGLTPDQRIFCCTTMTGTVIDQARENLYWQPVTQPSALDDELSAATAAERDAALDGFVRGIEDLATGITELGLEPHPADALLRWMPIVLIAALGVLVVAAIPRGRRVTTTGDTEGAPVPAVTAVAPERAVRWMPRAAALYVALLGFGVLAVLTVIDLLRTPDPSVAFDPNRDTVGVAARVEPVLPVLAVAIALIALLGHALQGGRRRRLVIGAAIVVLLGSGWLAMGATRPVEPHTDIAWVSSSNGRVTSRGLDGLRELVTFDVGQDETFAVGGVIRNPGVLPLTILGLQDRQQTTGNPHVAAIVGLGWIPQPTDDGQVHVISAAPASASSAWPVTLAPGEELSVMVLGRGGECAEAGGTGPLSLLQYFPVRYRVLGIEQTVQIPLPVTAFVAARATCTVQIENGTITYGPVPSP
jgi:hypothetical protein